MYKILAILAIVLVLIASAAYSLNAFAYKASSPDALPKNNAESVTLVGIIQSIDAWEYPATGRDLLLLSMGIGFALTAAGFIYKFMLHRS